MTCSHCTALHALLQANMSLYILVYDIDINISRCRDHLYTVGVPATQCCNDQQCTAVVVMSSADASMLLCVITEFGSPAGPVAIADNLPKAQTGVLRRPHTYNINQSCDFAAVAEASMRGSCFALVKE